MSTPPLIFALCVTVALMTACDREQAEPAVAAEQEGGAQLYALPGLNHGLLQSPVNILSGNTEDEPHQIALNLHGAEPNYLSNTGETIKLDFPDGTVISFDGRTYNLKQVHFHTPSEHQIDGVTYPMEVHVVNSIEPTTPDEPPRYLVLSFLYRMGEEDPFIASFLNEVPQEAGGGELEPGQVYIADADRALGSAEYYHYCGSLTTPPYTETVEWLIQKQIIEASPEQIRRINLLEGNNARHVQPLYGRRVNE
jgi:carbonic anhydrase